MRVLFVCFCETWFLESLLSLSSLRRVFGTFQREFGKMKPSFLLADLRVLVYRNP